MWRYFELLSFRPLARDRGAARSVWRRAAIRATSSSSWRARSSRASTTPAAAAARAGDFIARVSDKALPHDLPVLQCIAVEASGHAHGGVLKAAGLAASGSEARRKIAEGAVRIDGEKVTDAALQLAVGPQPNPAGGSASLRQVLVEKSE